MKDSEYYQAAKKYFNAARTFQEDTRSTDHPNGIGAKKASEVLIAAVTNTWLKKHCGSAHISLNTADRGNDGVLFFEGKPTSPHAVEIKSGTGSAFMFTRKFLPTSGAHEISNNSSEPHHSAFYDHAMVIFGVINKESSELRCLYIAYGPDVMKRLANELENDADRGSYKPESVEELSIFTSTRKVRGERRSPCVGLADLAAHPFKYTPSGSDFQNTNWIKVLEGKELEAIIEELESSN